MMITCPVAIEVILQVISRPCSRVRHASDGVGDVLKTIQEASLSLTLLEAAEGEAIS
jgi:hypothetical protein